MSDTIDSIDISVNEPAFYTVSASFSTTDDRTKDFLAQKYWQDNYSRAGSDKNKEILQQVKKGDFLLLKTAASKGVSQSAPSTKLKAIGKITRKLNSHTFSVSWFEDPKLPRDFNGVWYGKTIEALRDDILLEYARDFVGKLSVPEPVASSL